MENFHLLSNNTKNSVNVSSNSVLESDSDNEDQEPEIINVEDDFVEGKEWNSDDSIDYDSE
jgi:hypothetical protein